MQLVCPHCGAPISAENINIQRMAAVCSECHTVFGFDPSETRTKRRKIKQPPRIDTRETEQGLELAFRTNFRLDRNEAFLFSAGLSLMFTFLTLVIASKATTNPSPTTELVMLAFGLVTLALYYMVGLTAFNKTHIDVDDEAINVSRKPLPNFLAQPNTISLAGVSRIIYEQTAVSKKEGYDTPRYNVLAEQVDGNPRLVVGDVIEDYAVFVTQRLNEFLDGDDTPDASRLQDEESEVDVEVIDDSYRAASHN